MKNPIDRRGFIKTALGAVAGVAVLPHSGRAASWTENPVATLAMPRRPLGKTGHPVCLFSLGGQSTLETPGTEEQSLAIINRALDLGVNYVDTAAAYGNGISETYIGRVMKIRRKEVYLASKTHDRSYDGSLRLLERTLKNLQTDHLDAWQLHHVGSQDDLDRIFAPNGALKAMEKMRSQKVIRFLGITGHKDPAILATAIRQYEFDTILMALNAADRHRKPFTEELLPLAVEKKMGIIGMKIPARGRIFRDGGITTMQQAMRYTLTLPVSTVIIGIDTLEHLEENIRIAQSFTPLQSTEMAALEEKTKSYYESASWFKFRG
ncbi:MAG: aldo/keto reductase [Acidobacteriia bacterium]|nr:aldo/keto reductase [Terriglobia bacterium]